MSDDQAIEVIRLRHRLRAMALLGGDDGLVEETLGRLHDISVRFGDAALSMELTRWRVRFAHLGSLRA